MVILVQSLGQVMFYACSPGTPSLAEMRDADKVCFLDAPNSQTGFFGNTVEDFAQQFLAVQNQTRGQKAHLASA